MYVIKSEKIKDLISFLVEGRGKDIRNAGLTDTEFWNLFDATPLTEEEALFLFQHRT